MTNKNEISLVLADDHPLLLGGLVNQLKKFNYNILATAENGADALQHILEFKPDIAILDEEMPELTGFEVIQKCKAHDLQTKFIILTSHKEKAFIYKAQKLNISGYILKDEPFSELHKCLQNVNKGALYFSVVFNEVLEKEVAPKLQKMNLLSPSERTIVKLIGQGKSSKEIGDQLFLSYRTIEKHRSNIISKLDTALENDNLANWAKENIAFIS